MKLNELKNLFIAEKKEELDLFNTISEESSKRKLTEKEKLDYLRELEYKKSVVCSLSSSIIESMDKDDYINDCINNSLVLEFDVDPNFLSSKKFKNENERLVYLRLLGIDSTTNKFKLYSRDLGLRDSITIDKILNNQSLFDKEIYIFHYLYDQSDECIEILDEPEDYIRALYSPYGRYNEYRDIQYKYKDEFESDKLILKATEKVYAGEVQNIFNNELLNKDNDSLEAVRDNTITRVYELDNLRRNKEKTLKKLNN